MDVRELINEYLESQDASAYLFDNPSFDKAIIGISYDNRVVYSYELMVKDLMEQDNISELEAIEFIDYNTLRATDYMSNNAPIVVIQDMLNI